ncbi:nitric oxide reductase activation protein NorD [Amphritea sp.]|uniref:nitric oxide reductase activation protein NorD n=1 Tax=Amphritea sp. TaxID=1872502 RepID=UPI003A954898
MIDVIRDAVHLFAECLAASGDSFAIHGFSSRRREHVRFNCIKGFNETYSARVRGRIDDISPGFYTRMGAAIRHATELLSEQPSEKKLLLLLTDGKPNDLDCYEGRHGVEDTRKAIMEARNRGLIPFFITIDEKASQYLPYLFGRHGYAFIRLVEQLPRRLPQLYLTLRGKLLG